MKTSTILIGGAVVAGAGFFFYRKAINDLSFQLAGVNFQSDGRLRVTIRVYNPSTFFGFPVPRLDVGMFDKESNYLGTISNNTLQYIPRGESFIEGYLLPNFTSLFTTLASYVFQSPTDHLIFQGVVYVGPLSIPFTTESAVGKLGSLSDGVKYIPLYESPEINVGDILVYRKREQIYKQAQGNNFTYSKLFQGAKKIDDTWYEVLKIYRTAKGEVRMRLKDLTYGYTPAAVISEWIAPKDAETFKVV